VTHYSAVRLNSPSIKIVANVYSLNAADHFNILCAWNSGSSSRKEENPVTATKDRPFLVLTVSLPKRR
jgi:hypothetical protein